jgi:cytosine/uracil/thiamine/allantoin permease
MALVDDWATSWDHVKILIFWAASTLMIAAVVLATGYFAHEWGIPLPMLRPLVGWKTGAKAPVFLTCLSVLVVKS